MYVCMYVCMYACMFVRMYVCMHVRMYACMHACIYFCLHTCITFNEGHQVWCADDPNDKLHRENTGAHDVDDLQNGPPFGHGMGVGRSSHEDVVSLFDIDGVIVYAPVCVYVCVLL